MDVFSVDTDVLAERLWLEHRERAFDNALAVAAVEHELRENWKGWSSEAHKVEIELIPPTDSPEFKALAERWKNGDERERMDMGYEMLKAVWARQAAR